MKKALLFALFCGLPAGVMQVQAAPALKTLPAEIIAGTLMAPKLVIHDGKPCPEGGTALEPGKYKITDSEGNDCGTLTVERIVTENGVIYKLTRVYKDGSTETTYCSEAGFMGPSGGFGSELSKPFPKLEISCEAFLWSEE